MLDKNSLYLVLNLSGSPVSVPTRNGSVLVPGGSQESPGTMPMSFDDIVYGNSVSNAYKLKILCFEPEVEGELYEALRNYNWQDILTNEQIKQIVLHPTMEGLQKFIDITEPAYFERVRGVYISLRNAGLEISNKVGRVIDGRYQELLKRKFTSEIKLKPTNETPNGYVTTEQYEDLVSKNQELENMIRSLMQKQEVAEANATAASESVVDKPAAEDAKQERKAANPSKPTVSKTSTKRTQTTKKNQ